MSKEVALPKQVKEYIKAVKESKPEFCPSCKRKDDLLNRLKNYLIVVVRHNKHIREAQILGQEIEKELEG